MVHVGMSIGMYFRLAINRACTKRLLYSFVFFFRTISNFM